MVPLPKPAKDPKNPMNNRPIRLTSGLCKTLEHAVNVQLMLCLDPEGHLSDIKCGFRKSLFTVDHLKRFETFIKKEPLM